MDRFVNVGEGDGFVDLAIGDSRLGPIVGNFDDLRLEGGDVYWTDMDWFISVGD
jgi:hypothetical protein